MLEIRLWQWVGKDLAFNLIQISEQLGEAGADAFTIIKLADHFSVTVSQRYVHPTPEAIERAFD